MYMKFKSNYKYYFKIKHSYKNGSVTEKIIFMCQTIFSVRLVRRRTACKLVLRIWVCNLFKKAIFKK